MVEKVSDNHAIGKGKLFKDNWEGKNQLFCGFQIQFAGALILGFNGLRIDCDFPLWMQYTLCGYMVSFLVRNCTSS